MRNRNMYYMTGLPGWMRFGYSPGWVGRSASGLGPGAEYLMTGQWPTPQMQMAAQGYPMGPMGMPMQGLLGGLARISGSWLSLLLGNLARRMGGTAAEVWIWQCSNVRDG